ncbi:MAG TPA: hypothetical protein VIK30_00690 [Polyangia bacterium]
MCFYDPTTKELTGQRVCVEDPTLCGRYCAEMPAGTARCDTFVTTVSPPACADAGSADAQ